LRKKQAKQFQKEHPNEPLPPELMPRSRGRPKKIFMNSTEIKACLNDIYGKDLKILDNEIDSLLSILGYKEVVIS
jgi:hypothetical protein